MKFYFAVIILAIYLQNIRADFDYSETNSSPCGDWIPYKNEKCLKILTEIGPQTHEDASKSCREISPEGALISIKTADEYDFLVNLIFNVNKFADNFWLGTKSGEINEFKWADGTHVKFTNWAYERPTENDGFDCVGVKSPIHFESEGGLWFDIPCKTNNLVVCEKIQPWPVEKLQTILLDTVKELKDHNEQLKMSLQAQNEELRETNKQIQNTKKELELKLIPIGFIYSQLPNDKSPSEIWPWMTWKDVSYTYEGLFFRVVGGNSAFFGEEQNDFAPRLEKIQHSYGNICIDTWRWQPINITPGVWSEYRLSGDAAIHTKYAICVRKFVSSGEVRPRNKAMRIWKRIQ